MTDTIQNFADDIFSISRPRKVAKPRQYRATWPCGSTWEFYRHDLDIPQFKDGEQTGLTHCYDTLKDALAYLPSDAGCTVGRVQ